MTAGLENEFVPDIGQSYHFDGRAFLFSDGVSYSLREALQLSSDGVGGKDLWAIHQVKKVFNGEIMECGPDPWKYCGKCRGKGRIYLKTVHSYKECKKCRGSGKIFI